MQIFNKASFLNKGYDDFLKAKISDFNREREVDSIISKIMSSEIKHKIKTFLRNEFPDVSDDTFLEAFEKIKIDIFKKDVNSPPSNKTEQKPPRYPIRKPILPTLEGKIESSKIASIPFERYRNEIGLRQIYGVLYFMKQGNDFPSATHHALKLFPNVKHYNTIEDKCARRFAGNVGTFITWFERGQILNKLLEIFNLSDHDYNIFKELLST